MMTNLHVKLLLYCFYSLLFPLACGDGYDGYVVIEEGDDDPVVSNSSSSEEDNNTSGLNSSYDQKIKKANDIENASGESLDKGKYLSIKGSSSSALGIKTLDDEESKSILNPTEDTPLLGVIFGGGGNEHGGRKSNKGESNKGESNKGDSSTDSSESNTDEDDVNFPVSVDDKEEAEKEALSHSYQQLCGFAANGSLGLLLIVTLLFTVSDNIFRCGCYRIGGNCDRERVRQSRRVVAEKLGDRITKFSIY